MVGDIEKSKPSSFVVVRFTMTFRLEREEKGAGRLCVLRIETVFYPFAKTKLASYLSGYPNLKKSYLGLGRA